VADIWKSLSLVRHSSIHKIAFDATGDIQFSLVIRCLRSSISLFPMYVNYQTSTLNQGNNTKCLPSLASATIRNKYRITHSTNLQQKGFKYNLIYRLKIRIESTYNNKEQLYFWIIDLVFNANSFLKEMGGIPWKIGNDIFVPIFGIEKQGKNFPKLLHTSFQRNILVNIEDLNLCYRRLTVPWYVHLTFVKEWVVTKVESLPSVSEI